MVDLSFSTKNVNLGSWKQSRFVHVIDSSTNRKWDGLSNFNLITEKSDYEFKHVIQTTLAKKE